MRGIDKALAIAVFAAWMLPAAASAQNVYTLTGGENESGALVLTQALIDHDDPIQGFSMGICHDGANIEVVDAVAATALAVSNNGDPPDFLAINTNPVPGPGVALGCIINLMGEANLEPAVGQAVLDVTYELIGVPAGDPPVPIVTDIFFCNTLATPTTVNELVIDTQSFVPEFVDAAWTIVDTLFGFDMSCDADTTSATVTWELAGEPFDYVLFHRNGELLEIFDNTVTSYFDPGLAPGFYSYVLIGVAFPDPLGPPAVATAECEVEVIPVVVDSFAPLFGPYAGGTELTILGDGFTTAPDTTVEIGGQTALNIVIVSDEEISCETPPVSFLGPVAVVVSNSLGTATADDSFTYGFIRGDINGDGAVDIADPVDGLDYLFTLGDAPDCFDALDANDDGINDIGDPIYVLLFLFNMDSPPLAPYPIAGFDPTEDDLDCLGTL